MLRDQIARLDDVKSLLTESDFGDAERDVLKSIRFRQGRIAQDADRAAQDLISIFNAFVYDRLGSPIPNGKIIAYLDAHHRATYGMSTGKDDESDERTAWKGDPVFPYALYDRIVKAWQDKTIYDRGLLERMLAALRDAVEAAARAAPNAHHAAARAADGDRPSVEALKDAQEAHVRVLQRLQESISGWQTLSDVTEALRGIVEDQKSFVESLEDKKKKDEKND